MLLVKELENLIVKYDAFTNLQFEEVKEQFNGKLNEVIQLKNKDFLKVFEELISWIKFCKENKISNKFIVENENVFFRHFQFWYNQRGQK
jgi:hypothetical protein